MIPFVDEWNNFMERINCKRESEVWGNEENVLQLRHWASLRGQTLCRTGNSIITSVLFLSNMDDLANLQMSFFLWIVRGMMYYRRALKLQAFLDMASESGRLLQIQGGTFVFVTALKLVTDMFPVFLAEILEGYKAVADPAEEEKKSQRSLSSQLEAVADMKFTYVATCQIYGNQKQSGDRRATDILNLMVK